MVEMLRVDDAVESSDLEILQRKVAELSARLEEAERRERELRKLEASLLMAQVQTVVAIVGTIEAKDEYTSGHSHRVAERSAMIGAILRFDTMRMRKLYIAALLHDVGKIGVYDTSLRKKSRLDDSEYLQLKEHPVIGERIVRKVDYFADLANIIRWHHERYDGMGYPDGMRGSETPIESAIICVADAYDAITTKRTYNKPKTTEQAVEEIMNNSGTQFNPTVVDALRRALLPNQLTWICLQDSDFDKDFEIPDAEA